MSWWSPRAETPESALLWSARFVGTGAFSAMPESMSLERRQLLEAFGAEVVLTPETEQLAGAVSAARPSQTRPLGRSCRSVRERGQPKHS